MSLRFNRKVRVTLATRLDPEKVRQGKQYFNAYTRQIQIENLRVQFEVTKTSSKEPNQAKIVITNLKSNTRGEFQALPAHIALEAGYGDDLHTIYKGDLVSASSKRVGNEWETEALAGTGSNATKYARISRSFKIGSQVADLVKATESALGLSSLTTPESRRAFLGVTGNGVTLDGPALGQLNKVIIPKGYTATVQDDQLIILGDDGVRRVQAVVMSEATGMVGSPEMGTPEAKGKPPVLKVKMLMGPDLHVGGAIVLQSRDLSGTYKILQVKHTGDTHGEAWYSEIEAVAR